MGAVITAIIAGLLAFLAKLLHDIRGEHAARKALAAALSGELGAYMHLLRPEVTRPRLKSIADIDRAERVARLGGAFSLPSGHPVFDRVADKIGTLSPEAAQGVSEAYNIVTGGRLILTGLSSDAFLEASDDIQKARIAAMAEVFIPAIARIPETVALLDRLSRQSFRCYLMGRD